MTSLFYGISCELASLYRILKANNVFWIKKHTESTAMGALAMCAQPTHVGVQVRRSCQPLVENAAAGSAVTRVMYLHVRARENALVTSSRCLPKTHSKSVRAAHECIVQSSFFQHECSKAE